MTAFDSLRSFGAALGQRLPFGGLGRLPPKGGDSEYVRSIAKHWSLGGFRVAEKLSDSPAANWRIESDRGTFVLRRVSCEPRYLEYQLAVMQHLTLSAFPYDVPVVRPLPTGERYLPDGNHRWLMFRFLEGEDAPEVSRLGDATDVGVLVGSYHQAMETAEIDLSTSFRLELFDAEDVARRLTRSSQELLERPDAGPLGEALTEHLDVLLDAQHRMPAGQMEDFVNLPAVTVYNDWHRYNRIARDGRIVGIIDFDSVMAAPRIVDFQNALTYILLGGANPGGKDDQKVLELAAAFARGYNRVVRLSALEVSMIQPVLLDRVLWLIGDIATAACRSGSTSRDSLGVQLIELTRWIGRRGDELRQCLGP